MVEVVTDLRGYIYVVRSMFEDGIVNGSRLAVLEQFTQDVCRQVKDPQAISQYYLQTVLPTLMYTTGTSV